MMLKLAVTSLSLTVAGSAFPEDAVSVRLKGSVGERLDGCIRNCAEAKDDRYLTDPFKAKSEVRWWRTEFWGKWMQSARPFADYADSSVLRAKIARSAAAIVSTQEADGYLGDYTPAERNSHDWDVWGHKYTLLGLMEAYRATGDKKMLDSARRLADHVRSVFGPGKRSLAASGNYHGLASLSILEPFVLLYRETDDKAYLDYASWIVGEMDDPKNPASPQLLSRAGLPPSLWPDRAGGGEHNRVSPRKAYESMSCWQGILEYAETVGDRKLVATADRAARLIASTEINVVGGAAHDEEWYGGATNQTLRLARLQETCVTTTWLRLCEKLLKLTRDPFYAEQIERTFFNAYLGAFRPDNAAFASYTPLDGSRSVGQYHCNMHENCCNANGPRGFLAYLGSYLTADGNELYLNHFTSARASAPLVAGGEAVFEVFSLYPRDGAVNVIVRSDRPQRFALNVRIPGWAHGATARIMDAGACVLKNDRVTPGDYLRLEREWRPGERLEISFPIALRKQMQGDFIAFAAGPLVLARDTRFNDGELAETLRREAAGSAVMAVRTRPWPDTMTTWAIALPLGLHDERPELNSPDIVRFCDYASAGSGWSPRAAYRTWLPMTMTDTVSSATVEPVMPAVIRRPPSPSCRPWSAPFRFGVARWTMHKRSLDDALAILQDIDCHALGLPERIIGYDASDSEIAALKAKCAAFGVEIVSLGPIYFDNEAEIRGWCSFAKRYGMKYVTAVPFEMNPKLKGAKTDEERAKILPEREWRLESDRMMDALERCAKEFDLRAGIHNHGPDNAYLYPTAESAMKRIGARDKRLGVCLDVGHERRAGLDPAAFVRANSDRIVEVHIKNIQIDPEKNRAKEGPRGELDIPDILGALVETGFDGYCLIEYDKDKTANQVPLAESLGYYRGVLDGLARERKDK